jgi:UDP-glucose 4-epimerase
MKYFVTGGAGFIGSHMVDALIREGGVTVYDNLTSGSLAYLEAHQDSDKFNFIQGDVEDLERLVEVMEGHEVVFHFASNPDIARSMQETDLDLREGTILTYNVLEAMRRNGIKTILYTSGSGIYGDAGDTPTPEDFGPLLPISMYGASKLACEGMISAFCHMFDMEGYIFRFANVVGRRQTHGVGYDFIRKLRDNPHQLTILGDGTQSKSYIHISDAVAAMLFVYHNAADRINVFNIATADYIDVKTIARIVMEEMGLEEVKLQYTGGKRGWKGDVPVVRFNLAKVHQLGWKAHYSSREAIRLSIKENLGAK